MAKTCLLGVDLGTSATKAGLYELDGHLIAEASVEVRLYYPQPGVVEQENEDFYITAAQAVSQCVQQSGVDPRQVAAIAFDSQMAGIGSVDENYRPATRFDSWLDMRCQPYIAQIEKDAGGLVTRLTGCPPTCDHGPKMLWWQHERPAEFARIAKFITPAGYVAGRMAGLPGEQAFMDFTFIHFSGFSDAQAGQWSAELCNLLGMDASKLPEIVAPWKVIGCVTDSAARDFGLAPGTPIAAGCGDTAANALGAGIVRSGMLFDVAGTAAVLAACTERFVADQGQRALLTMRSVIPGLWHPLAYIAGGGLALRWFREQFYNRQRGQPILPAPLDDGRGAGGEGLYEAMLAIAATIPPGAEGLFFSPHLGGRICPAAPEMRGAWVGFSWGHTQAHFLRAVLESVAFEYAYYLSILSELLPGQRWLESRAVGGGARSDLWNQIKADVLGVPYLRLRRNEFGTWGSALVAGKAVGLFDDLAVVASQHAQPAGEPTLPDPQSHAIYARLAEKYIALQTSLIGYFQDS